MKTSRNKKRKKSSSGGEPGPGQAQGDGGVSVQQYFTEQDQVEGSRGNPKKSAPPGGVGDLISAVDACRLINSRAGYLMFDPAAIYRDAGKTAPSVFELEAGAILPELPPPVPAGLPADLVARRPDVASAERELAARIESGKAAGSGTSSR